MHRQAMFLAFSILAATGCAKKAEETPAPEPTPTAKVGAAVTATAKPTEPAPPEPAVTEPAPEVPKRLRLVDFPHTKLGGEVGQYAFAPNDSSFVTAHESEDKHKRGRVSWGVVKIAVVGETESEVSLRGTTYSIPNAYLVPIETDAEISVGDFVATSKYGNTFDRAYVTAVGEKPKANYIRTMPYGESVADLKSGQYFKLGSELQPGSPVAVRTSYKQRQNEAGGTEISSEYRDSLELYMLLRIDGEKALLTGHMGKIATAPMSSLIRLPLQTELAAGATVTAVWDSLHFAEGTLKSVDAKLGHYVVDFGEKKSVKKVPFAELLPGTEASYLGAK